MGSMRKSRLGETTRLFRLHSLACQQVRNFEKAKRAIGKLSTAGEGKMLVQSGKRPFLKNTILAGLSSQSLTAIAPFLEPVVLRDRLVLQEPKRPVDQIYFVESGIVSLRTVAAESFLENCNGRLSRCYGSFMSSRGESSNASIDRASLRTRTENSCRRLAAHNCRPVGNPTPLVAVRSSVDRARGSTGPVW